MLKNKIPRKIIFLFCRQIGSLLEVGVPLLSAVKSFQKNIPDKNTAEKLSFLVKYLEEGQPLSQSLAKCGGFPERVKKIVQASEPVGQVAAALCQAAQQLEQKIILRQQIIFTLLYPAFILAGSFSLVGFWLIFILPAFQTAFTQTGGQLPLITQMLIAVSEFLRNNLLIILLVTFSAAAFSAVYLRTYFGRRQFSRFLWKIKPIQRFIQNCLQAELAAGLGQLLKNGLPLLPAVTVSWQAVDFLPAREKLYPLLKNLQAGRSLTDSLRQTGLFSPFFLLEVTSGEESSRLAETLEKAGHNYRQEIASQIKLFTSLLEPAATLVTGALVAFIICSIFLPLTGLLKNL